MIEHSKDKLWPGFILVVIALAISIGIEFYDHYCAGSFSQEEGMSKDEQIESAKELLLGKR